MYPYAEQLIAYKAHDSKHRMGGLVLEVKGDFCHKIKAILKQYGREEDYVEVNLNADYRYNPLYNDLDAYALAYNIASLLTNLFGRGKEPFWQQAYTNLVKFIIQLHKVAYDYVTLFDIYECAINPELLESKIHEAERMLQSRTEYLVSSKDFLDHPELEQFGFSHNANAKCYKAPQSLALAEALKSRDIPYRTETENPPESIDPLKREVLDGVKHVLGPEMKLSSLNARSADPHSDAGQPLHVDMAAIPDERGYWVCNTVWMLDDFTSKNGATRLVPGSHKWGKRPQDVLEDPLAPHPQEVLVLGRAGSIAVMNAHAWHGGTANRTAAPRLAMHAFYCRRDKPQQQYQKRLLRPEVQAGLTPALRDLLALDDPLNDELSATVTVRSGFMK